MAGAGLPRLRGDLALLPGPPDRLGLPSWTVHDPARNRFFQLGAAAVEMLRRWHLGDATRIVAAVRRETVLAPEERDFKALIAFLSANQLVERPDADGVEALQRIAGAGRRGPLSWLMHNYLFFRVPLVRPDRFLRALQPLADLLAGRWAWRITLILGAIGIYLASRQWDQFAATFVGFLSLEGAAWSALVLFLTKILHELGHGFAARRRGCRVPTMGIAFMVLYPVLYTDTTDAYRLTGRADRLAIGAAGIRVELALALIATFLWSFLPDGPIRAAVFLVATVTWVTTLAINLNPFMRFDGYYLLADAWGMPNLQPRAFALARWHLREALFGLGEAAPEPLEAAQRRRLIAYAYATWVYRFFLFIGIALLVYHLFFKALGLLLFAVEILWFILVPIWSEVKEWWRRREALRLTPNLIVSLLALGGLIVLLAWPWNGRITAPAVWTAESRAPLVTAAAGQVRALNLESGRAVEAGAVLLELELPDLDLAARRNTLEAYALSLALLQAQADPQGLSRLGGLIAEQGRLEAEARGIAAARARAQTRAPFAGIVVDMAPDLRAGTWVPAGLAIGTLTSAEATVEAFVEEGDLVRVSPGAPARFVPDDPRRPALRGVVVSIAPTSLTELTLPQLASAYGGAIAVEPEPDGALRPLGAWYRVVIALDAEAQAIPPFAWRGTALIEGPPASILAGVWRETVSVLMRESGF